MRQHRLVWAAVLTLAALVALPAFGTPVVEPSCAGFCAGAARADITPPVGTPMWGYSARAFYADYERWAEQRVTWADTDLYAKVLFLRSEGVHTRLFARAIVLKNVAGMKTALVQTDLGAVTGEVHQAVAKAVAPLGIGRDALLVSATHTHGGPGTIQQPAAHGLLVGDHFDPRTFKRVVDGVVRAVRAANERLAPARIGIGRGPLLDASVNRSMRAHSRGFKGNPNPCPDPDAYEIHPCAHPGESASDPHAIDPTVTVIRVDRTDGVPLGVWTNFAAHGTMFYSDDMRFSADNQGFAERMIERGIAERAPALPRGWEIVAAYANGTEGDIAPTGSGAQRFAAAEDSGRRQARAVLAVYDALATRMTDDVDLGARWDWLYMNGEGGTSPLAILGAGPDCPFGTGAPWPNEGVPGQGRKCPFLPLSGTGPNWFGLQVLRIGDLVVAGVPGEMTVQMGRRVKKRLLAKAPAGTTPIIAGLANDYMAYITTPEEYDVQDYEGTFTLWGRAQGPLVLDRLGALADRLFTGLPNPYFIEPPDTSGAQAENVSPSALLAETGRAPGTVIAQVPATLERGSVATFSWVGGPPSVEMPPDAPFVETRCASDPGGPFQTVFTDEGYEDIVDYWREGTEDRWGVQWDIPLDAPAQFCAFTVHGHRYDGAGSTPYRLVSGTFRVVPSDDLVVSSFEPAASGLRVGVGYPKPLGSDHPNFGQPPPYVHLCSAARGTATCNYRWRAAGPQTPSAIATVRHSDGTEETVTGSHSVTEGAYVFASLTATDLALVRFVDGDGNIAPA